MDTTKVDNITFEDIDYGDYPDFCDAFIANANYDGGPMTSAQLEEVNEDSEFVYEQLWEQLH